MNPDKLFDYLDGKLSPADRTALEEKLMSDAQLRQQFQIAREIHRSGRDSREVLPEIDDPETLERGAKLGRMIATAAIVLVFLNVAGGLAVITWRNKKPADASKKEAEIRRQLSESLGAAAQNAMPMPAVASEDIQISAPRAQWEEIANKIMTGASAFGGSASKGLPDDNMLNVIVDIPTSREAEFRQALASASKISPMPAIAPGVVSEPSAPNERSYLQVRIAEAPAPAQ